MKKSDVKKLYNMASEYPRYYLEKLDDSVAVVTGYWGVKLDANAWGEFAKLLENKNIHPDFSESKKWEINSQMKGGCIPQSCDVWEIVVKNARGVLDAKTNCILQDSKFTYHAGNGDIDIFYGYPDEKYGAAFPYFLNKKYAEIIYMLNGVPYVSGSVSPAVIFAPVSRELHGIVLPINPNKNNIKSALKSIADIV